MPRFFEGAAAQAEAMRAAWVSDGGSITDLTLDAFETLELIPGMSVLRVPDVVPNDSALGCSVAGGYRELPPTLIVTMSMSKRRQHFTLLHELGHHLQRTHIDLGRAVLRHKDRLGFEDAACDAFAASVLLPDDMVDDACVAYGGVTAQTAVDLFEASNASRAAIAVRIAGRLKGAGAVAVLNESGVVTFAAARGSIFPPARGSDQSSNPLIRAALAGSGAGNLWTRDDAQILYSTGHSSNQLYGQAAWVGDRLIAIMVDEAAPWRTFSPPRDFTAVRTPVSWDGPGLFDREQLTEKRCDSCFLVKHVSQFSADSTACKECA